MMKTKLKFFLVLPVVLMTVMMFVPQGVKADDTYYNFTNSVYGTNGNDGNTNTEWYDESYDKVKIGTTFCTYYKTLGNVSNPNRFATDKTNVFILRKSGGSNPVYGLCLTGTNTAIFVITKLFSGDVVTVNGSTNFALATGSSSANVVNTDGNHTTYTMTAKGSLALTIVSNKSSLSWIYDITITHDNSISYYAYDPAIEVYDLSGQTTSYSTSDAGFLLGYYAYGEYNAQYSNALYLTNLRSGMALNNRIAVSQSSMGNTTAQWVFDSGLKAQWSWHNVSICNLKKDDRVRITYTGSAVFSSDRNTSTYHGCTGFKDVNNDGELDNGEQMIAGAENVDNGSVFYTMTGDGHLDIGLSEDSKITKIEIYSDRQAIMLDKETVTGVPTQGYTSYFSSTGQLMAKEHIVPGGLNVYIGNSNADQHAEVVYSDEGPVSFVYDEEHYKMARKQDGTNIYSAPPQPVLSINLYPRWTVL